MFPENHLLSLAPAKINLFLHIVGRRSDGYHELQTAFQFINLYDFLVFRPRQDSHIHLHTHSFPSEENLVLRAARALKAYTNTKLGADIYLTKFIPVGAGLGGGSSDAATTLTSLNTLWNTQLSQQKLEELGVSLGADVPVFIRKKSCWAEGIGEKLTEHEWATQTYLLLIPSCRINTAEMYQHPELKRDTAYIDQSRAFGAEDLFETTHNDFEGLVRTLYKPVDDVFHWLKVYHPMEKAKLTGSGCGVFIKVKDGQQGHELLREIPLFLKGFVVRTF